MSCQTISSVKKLILLFKLGFVTALHTSPCRNRDIRLNPKQPHYHFFARFACACISVTAENTVPTFKPSRDEPHKKSNTFCYLAKSYWVSARKSQSLAIYSVKHNKTSLKSQEPKATKEKFTKWDILIPVTTKINHRLSSLRAFSLVVRSMNIFPIKQSFNLQQST